jgi:chromatin remodeling complex protein RSC6
MDTTFQELIESSKARLESARADFAKLKKLAKMAAKTPKTKKPRRKSTQDPAVPRKPSGFAAPVPVSEEMYEFLKQFGVEHGTPIARTEVTRFITRHIKEHGLQNESFKLQIIPDASLAVILGTPEETLPDGTVGFTYKKLQRYISRHFPKRVVKDAVAVAEQ